MDAAEAARKAEEELMEARRRELLSQEDGYWRRRMAQEAAAVALAQEALARVPPPVRLACGTQNQGAGMCLTESGVSCAVRVEGRWGYLLRCLKT